MQSTSKPNETLQDLLKRQNEMQYAAMAHSQAGQPLPEEFAKEYAELEQKIASFTSESENK